MVVEALTIPAEIPERFLTIPAVPKRGRGGSQRETLAKRSSFDDIFMRQCVPGNVFLQMERGTGHDLPY